MYVSYFGNLQNMDILKLPSFQTNTFHMETIKTAIFSNRCIDPESGPLTFDCRYLQSSVRCLLKSLTQDENWMVTQAKMKREKEDVYKKYPQLDPARSTLLFCIEIGLN